MPIKWTPEKDQTLLLKILETSSISADVKAISAKWPEGEEAPTPRAIQERLTKIRSMAKDKSNASFKIVGTSGSKSSPMKASPAKLTPRGTPKKNGTPTTKRKRGRKTSDNIDESAESETSFKHENNGSDASDDENLESPTKKVKAEALDGAYDIRPFATLQEV